MEEIKMSKKELADLVGEVAAEAAKKAVAEKTEEITSAAAKKFGGAGYKGSASEMSDAEFKGLEKKEKMASFIKAVYHKDRAALGMFKAMTEGTDSAGGFVVPEEFAAEVNRVVEDFGLVPKFARKFPMRSDVMNVPRLSATVAVYYPGEATAGTASQPTFERVVLTAKTIVGLTPFSNELLADANVSVVDLLVELFAEAIAGELDNQGFTGSGSPFTGIFGDSDVTKVYIGANATGGDTSFDDVTLDDTRNLISGVKPWSLQGAAFYMHRTVWAFLQTQKASTTGDYFISAINPVVTGASQTQGFPNANAGTLWGYPVYLSDKLPERTTDDGASTPFIIFGNLKHLYMGVRSEIGVAISDSATVAGIDLFAQNMSAIRVIARHALAVGLPKAFAILSTDNS